jgi:hypothetical protein
MHARHRHCNHYACLQAHLRGMHHDAASLRAGVTHSMLHAVGCRCHAGDVWLARGICAGSSSAAASACNAACPELVVQGGRGRCATPCLSCCQLAASSAGVALAFAAATKPYELVVQGDGGRCATPCLSCQILLAVKLLPRQQL